MTDHERTADNSDPIGFTLPADRPATTVHYADEGAILEAARRIGETVLGPSAQESDLAAGPNERNMRALAEAGLFGLFIPQEYGGLNASGTTLWEYTSILASYCGVTTFTQAQHHGPSRMIANGPNADLKARLLPDLARGDVMAGISFAHLRRPGPPVLRATPVAGGYKLDGKSPWVTGWGLIRQIVIGATLPDGRFVYLWTPCRREDFPGLFADIRMEDDDGGRLCASQPLRLSAMNASGTVEITWENWFIPEAHLLSESDRETMQRNDRNGVLGGTALPLGCAEACVRLLQQTAENRSITAIRRAADSFAAELQDARSQTKEWNQRQSEYDFFPRAVQIRAWCIELAMRAAQATVAASSGAANSVTHPAQRLLREAMFYTVQAQTHEVMDATLTRLERTA